MRYFGPNAHKATSCGVASVSGTILAVCSCTVLPMFAGIYRMGAGLGPAIAFLYSGPAINALAIIHPCSGAADTGEIAERVARRLRASDVAGMSCLAGIGTGSPEYANLGKRSASLAYSVPKRRTRWQRPGGCIPVWVYERHAISSAQHESKHL